MGAAGVVDANAVAGFTPSEPAAVSFLAVRPASNTEVGETGDEGGGDANMKVEGKKREPAVDIFNLGGATGLSAEPATTAGLEVDADAADDVESAEVCALAEEADVLATGLNGLPGGCCAFLFLDGEDRTYLSIAPTRLDFVGDAGDSGNFVGLANGFGRR